MNRTLKYALSAVLGTMCASVFVYADGMTEMPSPAPAIAEEAITVQEESMAGAESAAFPDTPQNHWAYEAVTNLKNHGILVGYPDGLFRGPRTATRYEMAVAINAAWTKLKAMYDGLEQQVKNLTDRLNALEGLAADVKALRDQLAALQREVDAMKPWGKDIENLKKLAEEFKAELAKLGADVEAMKRDLTAIEERLRKLELRRHSIDISGDANIVILGGHGGTSPCGRATYGITENGRITGAGRGVFGPGQYGSPVGPERDFSVFHEGAFRFSTPRDENRKGWPTLQATLVFGNMLSSTGVLSGWPPRGRGFGNQNSLMFGRAFLEGCESFYFQDFKISNDYNWGAVKFGFDAGRFGWQSHNPYMMKRNPYNELYLDNERWNNGDFAIDGGRLVFDFNNVAALEVFAGRSSRRFASNSEDCARADNCADGFECVDLNPIFIERPLPFCCESWYNNQVVVPHEFAHKTKVDQLAGAQLNIPIGRYGDINLAYLALATDNPLVLTPPYTLCSKQPIVTGPCAVPCGCDCDRVDLLNVYGGDITFNPFERVQLYGGYSRSDYACGTQLIWCDNNNSWFAQISYKAPRYGALVGYKWVEKNYVAPGAWDRLGLDWNPRDIQGGYANLFVDVLPNVRISGAGQLYSGISEATRPNVYYSVVGQIDWKVDPRWTITAKYEQVEFAWKQIYDAICESPLNAWGTVKTSYAINKQSLINVGYQFGGSRSLSQFHFNGLTCPAPGVRCCNSCAGETLNNFGDTFIGGLVFANLSYKF